MTINHF